MENAVDFLEKHGIACTSRFEQTLFDTMNGTCRELLSAYLEEAAKKHCDYNPVAGERNAGIHAKRITTLFGETEPIGRIYYWNKNNSEGHFPFDERLGLVGKYTPAVADEAMRCAAKQPYNEASKEFSRHHSFSLSKDAIREIVARRAKDVADFVLKHDVSPKEDSSGAIPIVCVMADGTGIPMRKSCLKGAKGKGGAAKTREVKAGAVFIASKTSDNEPYRNLDTTTYVATTHRKERFGTMLRAEFDRRFGKMPETVLYISDGGKWLHSIHDSLFPFAVEILDVYHAIEHLEPMMLGMGYKKKTKKWKYLYHYWKKRIKAGKVESVLNTIWKRHKNRLSKDAMREYKYFRSNKNRMRYDIYRDNGWFIGSGVIESGCKTVIGQRFKQSGMIWSLKGAKALLPVRTLLKSNRLEDFFRFAIRDLLQVRCAA